MNRYRYIDAGRTHMHQVLSVLPETGEEVWQPLIGTSTVAKESVNKGDGLIQWYADLAALDALGREMPPDVYESLIKDYEEVDTIQDWRGKSSAKKKLDAKYPDFCESRKAAIKKRDGSAEAGTVRHGVLEDYVKHCLVSHGGSPCAEGLDDFLTIRGFIDWSEANVAKFVFTEAYCFSAKLWLGGISDIGMILKDGRRVVGDHKSSKNAFFDQFIQCALYDIQLAENGILDRDGNKKGEWELADGYVVFPFRSDPFTPEFKWNAKVYRSVAEGVVRAYKLKEYDHV